MFKPLLPTLRLTIVLAITTGILFPGALSAISHLLFPDESEGSLLRGAGGGVIGSRLIGQNFSKPEYFHPRPSAAGNGYAAEASSGTNLGPTSGKLIDGTKDFPGIKQLAQQFVQENGLAPNVAVPVDAVTRSGSGLDPHISPENAFLQAPRVARARHMPESTVVNLVHQYVERRQLDFLREPRVNVLLLNLALDKSNKT